MSNRHSIAKRDRERAKKDRRARKLEARQAKAAERRGDDGTPMASSQLGFEASTVDDAAGQDAGERGAIPANGPPTA